MKTKETPSSLFMKKYSESTQKFRFVDNCPYPHYVRKDGKKTKKMKGLVGVLKDTFWSNYKRKMAYKIGTEYQKKKAAFLKRTGQSLPDNLYEKSGKGGLLKGKKVHEQMQQTVQMSWKDFSKRNPNIEPESYWLWAWIMSRKLKVLAPEVPVGFSEIDVATAVDMVCENKKGEVVLVEWKTGMENTFTIDTGNMKGVMNGYGNSESNQAQLQAYVTKMMFEETFGIKVKESLVVNINPKDVVHFEVDKNLNSLSDGIMQQIKKTLTKKRKIKKNKKN